MSSQDSHCVSGISIDRFVDSFLASDALHSIWPSFQTYLSRYFIWSDPVLQIARRSHSELGLRSNPESSDGDVYMAIHLRRGR